MVSMNAKDGSDCDTFFVASIYFDPSNSDDAPLDIWLSDPISRAEAEAMKVELGSKGGQVEIFSSDTFLKFTDDELKQLMWDRLSARAREKNHEGWVIFFERLNELIRLQKSQEGNH